jgi:Ca2+-binding RTX toxin-like protein
MADITGTSGPDVIEDTTGSDRVFALGGDDIIINRGGSDYFDGGEGQDTLRTDLTGLNKDTLNFDTVSGVHGRYQSEVGQDTIVSIENLTVIGDWDVRATGGDEDNVFRLSSGDDVVEAGGGNDIIYEGGGNDVISAGAGDDLIYNLGGSDVFNGGPGTDTIYTDLSPSVLRDLGLEPFSFEIKLDLAAAFHGRPSGTMGADVVQSIENYTLDGELNSQLFGDNNVNVFIGGGGSDLLEGRGGDDQLSGGEGTDTARYTNARSEYVVTTETGPEGQTLYRVTSLDQSETSEGSDLLFSDIELLEFAGEVMTIEDALVPVSAVTEGQYSLTAIANVFGSIMFLDGLTETVTSTSHTIEYNGTTFDYAEVDGIITTVVRDGEFTSEFAAEIAESFPDAAGISYSTAVALIGQANMESTLMMVAGADGNYVG